MSRALKLSEDLRPVSELKSKSSEVVRQVEATGRPVVLTRHGKGVAVVLSLAAYEELEASAVREELRAAVAAGEEQHAAGDLFSNDEVMAHLDEWSGGE